MTTAESREHILKKHLIPRFSECKISEIDSLAIDEFFETKLEENLSPAYIKIMYSLLNQAFDKAHKWKLVKHNPVGDVSPPIVKNKKKKILWTQQETKKFVELLTMKGIEVLYITTIFTGMRRGEILGLKWSDIDFNTGTIHVQRSLTRTKKVGIILKEVKSE